jgi:cytochrome c oxidase assembly protein subunit 15
MVANGLMVMAALQVMLGITTLLLVVPVHAAATHQAGAVLLFTMTLWFTHELHDSA